MYATTNKKGVQTSECQSDIHIATPFRMENNECNDEQIGYMLGRVNAENKGYFKEDSFVTYDDAMRILNIGSREAMQRVLAKHGVKTHTINNHKVGFLRTEVEAVATLEKRPQKKSRNQNLSNYSTK